MNLYNLLVSMGLAILVGTILGMFSYWWGQRNTGIRVFTIISLGCCLAAHMSINLGIVVRQPWMADPARIAAQLVSAVGFIVAGMIWYLGNQAKGLSSAALLWVNAILGLMIGAGYYRSAVISFAAVGIALLLIEVRISR